MYTNLVLLEKALHLIPRFVLVKSCSYEILGKIKNVLVVKCYRCSQDSEMYGLGVFKAYKSGLKSGKLPCGCSVAHRKTPKQYEIIAKRIAMKSPYLLKGFVGRLEENVKLILECSIHGVWDTTSLRNFRNGRGCPGCASDIRIRARAISEEGYVDEMNKAAKERNWEFLGFSEDFKKAKTKCLLRCDQGHVTTTIQMDNFRGGQGCPICALGRGGRYRFTRQDHEKKILAKCQELNVTFQGWATPNDDKNLARQTINLQCPNGHTFTSEPHRFVTICLRCPSCRADQRQAYVNTVEDNGVVLALKFGIGMNADFRRLYQNRKSVYDIKPSGVWVFSDSYNCKEAEKYLKKVLKCGVISKTEMEDGHSETTSPLNYDTIIKTFEDFGGIKQ